MTTHGDILRIVGIDFEEAMSLVESIRCLVPEAEYQNIRRRGESTPPSVFLCYDGKRLLSFDLRKGGGVKVYFWLPHWLTQEVIEKFNIVPEIGSGWHGFLLTGPCDPLLTDALSAISSYWLNASTSVREGFEADRWKRERFVKSIAMEAFPEEEPLFNLQSIPGSKSLPDIFLPKKKAIIQVDGEQHFKPVAIFRDTKKDLEDQIARDEESNAKALEAGMSVLRIVTDAAYLLSATILKQIVAEAAGHGEVMYLVRQDHDLVLTSEKPTTV